MNFGDLLKAWPILYRYKFYECLSFRIIHTKDVLISIHTIEMRGYLWANRWGIDRSQGECDVVMGLSGCPETSVTNSQATWRNITEDLRP